MNARFHSLRASVFRQLAAAAACLLLASCGGGGGGGAAAPPAATPQSSPVSNAATVVVDSGPAGAGGIINVPFVSVTLCIPGTSTCQTIDHVLVDTGSYGLRIIAPGVLNAALALPAVTAPSGIPVGECIQFVNFSLWGSVRLADVKIAGETAPSLPVQLAADAAFIGAPPGCNGALDTVAALGAKGILGVGLFKQDCNPSPDCTTLVDNGMYYACTASGCTGTTMPLASQVTNPVAAFATDNNGVVLVMPAVPAGGATTLTGTLIFGIDTQANNQVGSATVYAADSNGNFITFYNGKQLSHSFLDSGSNGLFFPDSTVPLCLLSSGFGGFYCPAAPLSLSAVNQSATTGASGTVNFTIVNPQALDTTIRAASIGGSFGSATHSTSFDWGLPFFFNRTVFVAIDGAITQHGTGPYWAY